MKNHFFCLSMLLLAVGCGGSAEADSQASWEDMKVFPPDMPEASTHNQPPADSVCDILGCDAGAPEAQVPPSLFLDAGDSGSPPSVSVCELLMNCDAGQD